MDSGGDWTASALFSPSKARAQQAQAKDWASVEAWLARKYGHMRLPALERNEETLQALLDLATFNDGADERQALVERVEKSVLQTILKRHSEENETTQSLLASLNGQGEQGLNALAESAVLLNTDDILAMARKLQSLTSEQFELSQRISRVQAQQGMLDSEQSRLANLLKEIKSEVFIAPATLPEQTIEWTRNTKQLKAKILEYDERLSALGTPTGPTGSVEQLTQKRSELEAQRMRSSELHAELAGFRGLPSDDSLCRLFTSESTLVRTLRTGMQHARQKGQHFTSTEVGSCFLSLCGRNQSVAFWATGLGPAQSTQVARRSERPSLTGPRSSARFHIAARLCGSDDDHNAPQKYGFFRLALFAWPSEAEFSVPQTDCGHQKPPLWSTDIISSIHCVQNAYRWTTNLEFSDDQGKTWVQTTRDTNDFFKAPGTLSSSTAWVKVTSHTGTTVVVKDVNLASGKETKATTNYA